MIDIAGLVAAAVLLFALIGLEVRHTASASGQPASLRLFNRAVNIRIAVGALWLLVVILLFPRVLGLLT
ncbi:hypothetical protein [Pseudarthrobacter niigatensis]|uniref:Uncharacterized protein n=1 Tax=Pseudarthrobacter niigatensis TaxID=369935 RepID=A0AAJ1SYG2_9MICC|nr:hypothetical protein [Pseudarthrobacter niigatensis]MDQ0147006.1 hypothetical protein [Pseudarthrobacter niigatensis]MDQ0267893.1 hypothetical protein [Pseudarthrobacter niigatensis]